MGDAADDAIDSLLDWHLDSGPRVGPKSIVTWGFPAHFFQTEEHITKDGTRMTLEEMTPRHRGNTIRLRERNLRENPMPGAFNVERFALELNGKLRPEIDAATRDRFNPDSVALLHLTPLIRRMIELGAEGYDS